MSTLWEVDPNTKAKLLEIQKQNGNNSCVDCGAPSPQWASPKFGVFMCLNCSGIHRGLGVHISFIRSVTMDGFKVSELNRMQLGGNKPWKDFFDAHKDNKLEGRTFDASTVKDRYDSEAGEEYKERLTAKAEGKEYVPGVRPAPSTVKRGPSSISSSTPQGSSIGRSDSPRSGGGIGSGQKVQNEAYFARMGAENASRSADLPPSQGGKFGGFGSEPPPQKSDSDWLEGFQKDPMAGLTKGFGWLGKSAKTGYDGWLKPNVQKLAESDLAAQARLSAAQLGQNLQAGTRTATESFNRFVEGESNPNTTRSPSSHDPNATPAANLSDEKRDFWDSFGEPPKGPSKEKEDFWDSFGAAPKGPPKEKKDFWDDFADAAETHQHAKNPTSIGTSAMRNKPPVQKLEEEQWKDW